MSVNVNRKSRIRKKRENYMNEGLLICDLNLKVDELFIRWFNLPSTQENLKKEFSKIKQQKKLKNDQIVEEKNNNTRQPVPSPRSEKSSPALPVSSKHEEKPLLSPRRRISNKKSAGSPKFTNAVNKPSSPVKKREENISSKIPRFYFPNGQPSAKGVVETTIKKIGEVFDKLGKEKLTRRELGPIAIACGVSEYWKAAIFTAASNNTNTVSRSDVINMWKKVTSSNHDDASRFISMLSKTGRPFLEFEDFLVLLQDIVEGHPGLVFLRDAPEFHTRYMKTVIARIFYQVNRSWSGQITVNELRKSNFLSTLAMLDDEEDINAITEYFSYEHFYVIYCKFWELDMDHDLVIDKLDFLRHSNGALSSRLIDRVLCGAVTRWDASDHQSGKMSYVDFVWFLISEEDKSSQTSIEYWFRCMDLDGDGVISMYEMEFFYEEQMRKLEQLDIEPLPFEDCICQMLDMVKPSHPDVVTLKDLKNCKMANVFFDTFFNVEKYLEHEQKDPFAPPKDQDTSLCEPSDWEKYAAEEYEILVAEEQANDPVNNMDLTYEEEEIDPLVEEELRNLGIVTNMASLGAQGHRLADARKRERYSLDEANPLDPVKS